MAANRAPRRSSRFDEIPQERHSVETLVLLGRINDTSFFCVRNRIHRAAAVVERPARFEDLRLVASLLPPEEAGLLG